MNELWLLSTYCFGRHGMTAITPIKVFSSAEKVEEFKSKNNLDEGYYYKVGNIGCEL